MISETPKGVCQTDDGARLESWELTANRTCLPPAEMTAITQNRVLHRYAVAGGCCWRTKIVHAGAIGVGRLRSEVAVGSGCASYCSDLKIGGMGPVSVAKQTSMDQCCLDGIPGARSMLQVLEYLGSSQTSARDVRSRVVVQPPRIFCDFAQRPMSQRGFH